MKKLLISILILIIPSISLSASLKPYAFPFIGRWQPSEDPLLIDDYGFQDIQNLRKDGKRLRGVSGHTKINTTAITTYTYPKNGFHYKKDQFSETHLLMQMSDSTESASYVYQNTTAIPSQGNFSSTVLYTDDTSAGLGRFSDGPQGTLLYCNGAESLIYSGDETYPTSVLVCDSAGNNALTNPKEFTDEVTNSNNDTDNLLYIGGVVDANCVILLHMNGAEASTTFTDSSLNGLTVTANGDAQISALWKKFGNGGGKFDGTGDYLSISDSDGVDDWFDFDTNDLTIDTWVRTTRLLTTYTGLFSQRDDDDNKVECWVKSTSGGTIDYLTANFKIISGAATLVNLEGTSATQAAGHHVAIIRGWGGDSTSWALVIDGTAEDTATADIESPDLAGNFEIGRAYSAGSAVYLEPTSGYAGVDEFMLSNGVARYESNFSVPTSEYNNDADTLLVGYTRPIKGLKVYVEQGNNLASQSITGYEIDQFGEWSEITLTDNTSAFTSTGTITWSSTKDSSKTNYLNALPIYWYKFVLSGGCAYIYQITVDADFQEIRNIWSGEELLVSSTKVYANASQYYKEYEPPTSDKKYKKIPIKVDNYYDYTVDVQSDLSTHVAVLDSLGTNDYILLGFNEPITGINFRIPSAKENSNASVMTVYYWNGTGWLACANLSDGTIPTGTGISLGQSGVVSFDQPSKAEEFQLQVSGDSPMYRYKVQFSAALDAETELYRVTGIPAQTDLDVYKFPGMFQNRAWLFSEVNGERNKAIYSAFNSADIWNGSDSGEMSFGDGKELTGYGVLYSGAQAVMVVTKANSTYLVTGSGPEDFSVKEISSTLGCPAPLTIQHCESVTTGSGSTKELLIWQTSKSVVMCDGVTIVDVSDDIKCYFDPNDSRYIPASRIDDSVGNYDPNLSIYRLFVSSGSGQTTHNVELEYSIKSHTWTKIYRENSSGANPLQVAFQAYDTNGKQYSYGATNEGYVYRLENGYTWDGVAIEEFIQTKDLLLDDQLPLMNDSIINYMRLTFETKSTGASEDISITHYCNQSQTTDGSNGYVVPDDIDLADGPVETRDCYLGPCLYHSFKFSADISTVADGLELTGLGMWVEILTTINTED